MKRLHEICLVEEHFGLVEIDIEDEDDIGIDNLNKKARKALEEYGVDAFESYGTTSTVKYA